MCIVNLYIVVCFLVNNKYGETKHDKIVFSFKIHHACNMWSVICKERNKCCFTFQSLVGLKISILDKAEGRLCEKEKGLMLDQFTAPGE